MVDIFLMLQVIPVRSSPLETTLLIEQFSTASYPSKCTFNPTVSWPRLLCLWKGSRINADIELSLDRPWAGTGELTR